MLQKIGDALKGEGQTWRRWTVYLLFGALSLVFVAWGAYGIVNLSVGASSYAAEANGSKIPIEEARNAWLRQQTELQIQLRGAEIPAPMRAQFQDRVLETLIRDALLDRRTHDLGYRVSREALREAVQSEPAFQVDGQYSPDAAKAALAQAGITLEAYERELRTEVQRAQLQGGIRASDFATAAELQRLADLEGQEREVRYLVLPAERFKPSAAAADAAVKAYYDAHRAQYLTRESVHLRYAELRLEALEAQQTVTDADLRALYETNKSRLGVAERRHGRHILITGSGDAARVQAEQVLAQAKSGKDFAELAKQYSKDPGSAHNGGDLGWADRTSFVKPFADALFSMSVGEIRGPVQTQFGYHIIRLDEIQAGKSKSFEEARPDLEAQLRRQRATDRFGEIQEQLQSKLTDPGADLTALAQEYSLQSGDVPNYEKGAGAAPLGPAPPLQDLLFGDPPLAVGKAAGPVLVGDDRLVVVKVIEHRKPEPKPLAEVRDSIVAAIGNEAASQAALKAAQSAADRLAGGASFEGVAQELKVSADPAHFINRTDPSVPAKVREAAFALPRPAGRPEFRAVATDNGAAVLTVSAVRNAPLHDVRTPVERSASEARRLGSAEALAYVEEVRRTADVRKNPKAFE
jgi:peptidyl-prolyl cis-trans isomerase D